MKIVSTTSILQRMLLPTLLLLCGMFAAAEGSLYYSTGPAMSNSSCERDDYAWNILAIQAIQYLSGTIETFFRAFCFGYGVHVLIYLLCLHPNTTFDELKARMNVSLTAGLAFGCIVYGGSMVRETKNGIHTH